MSGGICANLMVGRILRVAISITDGGTFYPGTGFKYFLSLKILFGSRLDLIDVCHFLYRIRIGDLEYKTTYS